jgi:hypothetical protein
MQKYNIGDTVIPWVCTAHPEYSPLVDCIIREVSEIELHPNNMNREVGFCLILSSPP